MARVRVEADAQGLVSSVVRDTDPRPHDSRLPGLVLPGFANTHSHAFHRALRGRTHGAGGTFWTWRDRMYALADKLDPDSYRELATAVYDAVPSAIAVVGVKLQAPPLTAAVPTRLPSARRRLTVVAF